MNAKFGVLRQKVYDDEIYKWWVSIGKKYPITNYEARSGRDSIILKYKEISLLLDMDYFKRRIKYFAKKIERSNTSTTLANIKKMTLESNANKNSNLRNDHISNEDIIITTKFIEALKKKKKLEEEIKVAKDMINKIIKDTISNLEVAKLSLNKKKNLLDERQKKYQYYEEMIPTIVNAVFSAKAEIDNIIQKRVEIEEKNEFYRMCMKFEQVMLDYGKYHNYDGCEDECCNKEFIYPKTPWSHFRYHCFDLAEFYCTLMGGEMDDEWDDFVEIFDNFLIFRDKMINEYMFYESLDVDIKKKYRKDFFRIILRVYQIMFKHVEHVALKCSCIEMEIEEENFDYHVLNIRTGIMQIYKSKYNLFKPRYNGSYAFDDDDIIGSRNVIKRKQLVKGQFYKFLKEKISEVKHYETLNS